MVFNGNPVEPAVLLQVRRDIRKGQKEGVGRHASFVKGGLQLEQQGMIGPFILAKAYLCFPPRELGRGYRRL